MSTTLDLVRLRAHVNGIPIDIQCSVDAAAMIAANGGRLEELSPADGGIAPPVAKRGRLPAADSTARRMSMLAILRQHPSMRDDARGLGDRVGVSPNTVRAWLADEERIYRASLRGTAAELSDEDS